MGRETELKFLIEMPEKFPACADVSRIEQYYLNSRDGYDARRVRARTRGDATAYTYTEKRRLSGITREENERKIDKKEFAELLKDRDPKLNAIGKTRYVFPYDGLDMEIDVFDFWDKVAILEIELADEGEPYSYPPELKIIKEVTSDSRFMNKSLALSIPDLTEFGIK